LRRRFGALHQRDRIEHGRVGIGGKDAEHIATLSRTAWRRFHRRCRPRIHRAPRRPAPNGHPAPPPSVAPSPSTSRAPSAPVCCIGQWAHRGIARAPTALKRAGQVEAFIHLHRETPYPWVRSAPAGCRADCGGVESLAILPLLVEVVHPFQVSGDKDVSRCALLDLLGQSGSEAANDVATLTPFCFSYSAARYLHHALVVLAAANTVTCSAAKAGKH
jgi:hypothetical protein